LNTAESKLTKQELESTSTIKRLKEKNEELTHMKEELDKQSKSQLEQLNMNVLNLKHDHAEEASAFRKNIEDLKSDLRKKEDAYQELNSVFEREKIILNSKITHLEEFKTKLASDLSESNSKFEHAMSNFNNRNLTEKERSEKNQEFLLKSLDQKHKDEIEDLTHKIDKLQNEFKEKEK